jgi:hypothetical protein
MKRGQRGRDLAMAVLAFAAILGFVVGPFLFVAAPVDAGGMWAPPDVPIIGVAGVGFVGLLIGAIWIVRISRTNPEPDQRAWRYRARWRPVLAPSTHDWKPTAMTRGQRGRDLARAELAIAAIVGFIVAPFLYVAAPGFTGPPSPDVPIVGFAGLAAAGILIGFTWMVRIYRADPEPDQRAWRYRERG